MTKERSGGLPKTSGQTKVGRPNETTAPDELQGKSSIISAPPKVSIPLFIGLGLVIVTTCGGAYFLTNAPLIEPICRQVGNCQRFKEDSDKAQESFNKAEKIFKSKNSLPELLAASKSIDEAKAVLSTIPDNAKELAPPIAEQRSKIAELDKKIAILLTLEENADKSLKDAIAKIANADQLDRNPQGKTEPPETTKSRLAKPKALYVDAQVLLKSIPDTSLVAKSKEEKLKQLTDKIKDLDSKIGAVAALDPCVVKPSACAAAPVTPNPSNPEPYPDPPVQWSEPRQTEPQPPTKRPLWGPGSSGY
jgi:uncharacterized coiled-coil protein SlyX